VTETFVAHSQLGFWLPCLCDVFFNNRVCTSVKLKDSVYGFDLSDSRSQPERHGEVLHTADDFGHRPSGAGTVTALKW
jgi:hypothetical protein